MKILQGGIVTLKENIRYLGKKSFYTTATAFIVHSAHFAFNIWHENENQ